MEQQMQDQIEGAIYHMNEFYDEILSCTKEELYDRLQQIEYKLSELNEHGLSDSNCEREKCFLIRDQGIIKKVYENRR